MKNGSVGRHMLQATLTSAFRDNGPKRSFRNLVELGEKFSAGRRQRAFFSAIREMLRKDSSAYYLLWERVVRDTDHDCLQTFGINVGYNGCTSGIRTLRALERIHRCGIPAIVGACYNGREMDARALEELLRQGEKLGIFTYVVDYRGGDVGALATVLAAHKDAGFIVLTGDCALENQAVSLLTARKNVMLAVSADRSDFSDCCQLLHEAHALYCVYAGYDETRAGEILGGDFIERIGAFSATFVLLLPEDDVTRQTSGEVGAFAAKARRDQRWPFIPMDLREDLVAIERNIARCACFVRFDPDGRLVTQSGRAEDPGLNMRSLGLLDIFKKTLVLE